MNVAPPSSIREDQSKLTVNPLSSSATEFDRSLNDFFENKSKFPKGRSYFLNYVYLCVDWFVSHGLVFSKNQTVNSITFRVLE